MNRLTESGETRTTESGAIRITEDPVIFILATIDAISPVGICSASGVARPTGVVVANGGASICQAIGFAAQPIRTGGAPALRGYDRVVDDARLSASTSTSTTPAEIRARRMRLANDEAVALLLLSL